MCLHVGRPLLVVGGWGLGWMGLREGKGGKMTSTKGLISTFFFYPSSSISSLCSVSTTASEVTTQLSPAIHLGQWQRILSVLSLRLPRQSPLLLLPPPSFIPSLRSNQTCNYSVGQRAPRWPTVKYGHQFGPYPFIAIPPPSIGSVCFSSPPSYPMSPLFRRRRQPLATSQRPFHPSFTSPPSQLPRGRASRWGILPGTICT